MLTILLPVVAVATCCYAGTGSKQKPSMEFTTLKEAMEFVIHCIDNDNPDLLIEGIKFKRSVTPTIEDHKGVFEMMKAQHKTRPYQELIKGMKFPKTGNFFKVGGHGEEFNHIHIDFEKINALWYLKSVWACR